MSEKVRVILKSGNEFVIECKEMNVTYSTITGALEKVECKGCTKNRPLYLDIPQVSAILQEDF